MRRYLTHIALASLMVGLLASVDVPLTSADQGSASGANGTRLTVSPRTISNLTGEVMVRVTGSGFSATENGGVGVYLSFGPRPGSDRVGNPAYTDVTIAYDGGAGHGTRWIRPGTASGPNQAHMDADGSFSVELAVKASFTSPNGVKHTRAETLGVYAYAAHGTEAQASSHSQRAFVAVAFKAAATARPTAKPTPKPTAKPTPRPTTRPTTRPDPTVTAVAVAPSLDSTEPPDGPSATAPAMTADTTPDPTPTGPSARPSATPSSSPGPSTTDPVATAATGPGPAIPLIAGLLILVVVGARRLVRTGSGQGK